MANKDNAVGVAGFTRLSVLCALHGTMSAAKWLAAICGIIAAALLLLYYILLSRLTAKKKKKGKKKKEEPDTQEPATNESLPKGGRRKVAGELPKDLPSKKEAIAKHLGRGPEVLAMEALLKRDALHVFRRLEAASAEEKPELYAEAVRLFDGIESRGFCGMGALTSARIVFCNAVMECDGLEALRGAQDVKDSAAAALVERIVPIIFST